MDTIINRLYPFVEKIIINYRRLILIMIHLVHVVLANYLAFVIRFESIISPEYLNMFAYSLPLLALIRIIFFLQGGLHKDLWRYSSINDMIKIVRSTFMGSTVFFISMRFVIGNTLYPLSIYVLDGLLLILISGGSRLLIRVFREYIHWQHSGKKVLIVGAGDGAEKIIRDMRNDQALSYRPIGIIDEDRHKKGLMINGVPILGPISIFPYVIEKYKIDEVMVTMSFTTKENIKRIYELCKHYNVIIKKLPGVNDILDGTSAVATKLGQALVEANLVTEEKVQKALSLQKKEGGRLGSKLVKLGCISHEMLVSFLNKQFGISHMKPMSLEDLLQREAVKTDIQSVREFINNKRVLVTGAGGSIGSELCRQIIQYNPSVLILFERYENSLYQIDLELKEEIGEGNGKPRARIIPVIGDIAEPLSLEYTFKQHRPQIIFHAAAHKHVPLMEHNPIESVKNNILGTNNLIDTASTFNAESFVMISTDKAVNPTSIMGATKRVAELLTISANAKSNTKFTTVRFGNVLGSNGSVIPIFKEQLKKGGPLTVTHPDIKRYFMLIGEAVQLVLVGASSGYGGEIFVLDMGEQIKIGDLAENLIRLSGFIPDREIKVQYTGLRPGEKLYEELFDSSERIIPTSNDKLRIAIADHSPISDLATHILEFQDIVAHYDVPRIAPAIHKIVPHYLHEEITTKKSRMKI
jgi:FlaA1/EpsC-like NDP-sugar epimerase